MTLDGIRRARIWRLVVATGLTTASAEAGFTETVPQGLVLADVSYRYGQLDHAYDNEGKLGPLIDKLWGYEPGGGLQGVVTPNVSVRYHILLNQLQVGLLEDFTFGVAVPIVLKTSVDPTLVWEPGDYQWTLGRAYSADDFWAWAASMGQPKPERWTGNEGVLSDIVLGWRFRWTDRLGIPDELGLHGAATVMGALPTGRPADPEEIVSAGTTLWDLHAQGELGIHLSVDKTFPGVIDDRLQLGLDMFYEAFLPKTYDTPRGERHPLLLNFAPYVGDTYRVNPGDFLGMSAQVDIAAIRGPSRSSWITGGDASKAEGLPPLLSAFVRYTYTYVLQSDWTSRSDLWDWDHEKLWRPGYKNIVTLGASAGLLRVGIPTILYAELRTLTLLPGRNTRAADVFTAGVQVPVPLW